MISEEKQIERRLVQKVQKMNGWCIKLAPTFETGLPDRMCLLPGGVVIFVELKASNGILSPKQQVWRNRLQKSGHEIWVIFGEKGYLRLEERLNKL